jgi:hypothetical protein
MMIEDLSFFEDSGGILESWTTFEASSKLPICLPFQYSRFRFCLESRDTVKAWMISAVQCLVETGRAQTGSVHPPAELSWSWSCCQYSRVSCVGLSFVDRD